MRFFVSFNWLLTITMRSHTLFHTRTHMQRPAHTYTLTMFNQLIFLKKFFRHTSVWMPEKCLICICCLCVSYATDLLSHIFFQFHFVYSSPTDIHLLAVLYRVLCMFVCLSRMFTYIFYTLSACSHLESPVETTFDTIFTNITVLPFVSVISILFWVSISK